MMKMGYVETVVEAIFHLSFSVVSIGAVVAVAVVVDDVDTMQSFYLWVMATA